MNIYLKLLFSLLLGFSQLALAATPITQIESWSSDQNYQRGDLVEYQQTAYIALLSSKNIKPKKVSVLWRPVNVNSTPQPKPGKLYLLGAVVAEGDSRYIAKKLNILHKSSDLQDSEKWIAYSGKPPLPDTPNDDPIQQLLGEDKNNNGVRDDFEELILSSELAERTKQHALQAARAYGHALTLHMTGETISHAQAHQAMQHLIFAEKCRRQYAKEDGVSWRESDYYNDIDRLEASFMSDYYLAEIVGEDKSYVFPKDSCQALANAVGAVE